MIDSEHFIKAHNEYLRPPSTYEEEPPECDQCDDGLVDQHEEGTPPIKCDVCNGTGFVTKEDEDG